MSRRIRIIIADDHRLMLDGLATLIESIDDFELAGKENSGKDLLLVLKKILVPPDICIVDIDMPGMDGVKTVKHIRELYPKIKVMALTMHDEWHFVSRMIAAGAHGYLLKNIDRDVFISSVRRIMSGSNFFTEGITERAAAPSSGLTDREQEILKHIAQGKTNKEISEALFISDRTAETHRTNIKRKLNLSTLAQLIAYAKEHNL